MSIFCDAKLPRQNGKAGAATDRLRAHESRPASLPPPRAARDRHSARKDLQPRLTSNDQTNNKMQVNMIDHNSGGLALTAGIRCLSSVAIVRTK